MASLNKVCLIGNLGADPEFKIIPNSNEPTATISVATTERYTDKNTKEDKSITDWHRVVFWGKQAEVVNKYLKKGSQVYIEGKLKTRKYTDREGIERYVTEIRATLMQMLGKKDDNEQSTQQTGRDQQARNQYEREKEKAVNSLADMSDDIPF